MQSVLALSLEPVAPAEDAIAQEWDINDKNAIC